MTDFPERAKRVGVLANEHADAGDKNGRLADAVVAALHREQLYGMWVPRVLGGAELTPVESLQVIENVAYGDPSTGWVLMAAALAIGTGAAYLGDSAVKELFGGDRFPVIAGQGTRPGNAIPVDGGFRLSGSWSFASGIKHGTHIHTSGHHRRYGRAANFRLACQPGNAHRQLGCDGPARNRQHRLHHRLRIRSGSVYPLCRDGDAAARRHCCTRLESRDSPQSATPGGPAASDDGYSTSLPRMSGTAVDAPVLRQPAKAFLKTMRGPKAFIALRARWCMKPGKRCNTHWNPARNFPCGNIR